MGWFKFKRKSKVSDVIFFKPLKKQEDKQNRYSVKSRRTVFDNVCKIVDNVTQTIENIELNSLPSKHILFRSTYLRQWEAEVWKFIFFKCDGHFSQPIFLKWCLGGHVSPKYLDPHQDWYISWLLLWTIFLAKIVDHFRFLSHLMINKQFST